MKNVSNMSEGGNRWTGRTRRRRRRRRCSEVKKGEKGDNSDEGSLLSGEEHQQCGVAGDTGIIGNENKENTPVVSQVTIPMFCLKIRSLTTHWCLFSHYLKTPSTTRGHRKRFWDWSRRTRTAPSSPWPPCWRRLRSRRWGRARRSPWKLSRAFFRRKRKQHWGVRN